jgi:hypothetical protein
MDDVGKFYGHFVYFTAIWYRYIFYSHVVHFMAIWYIFPVLVCCTKENLATLMRTFKTLLNRFKAIDKKKKSLAEALTPYFRLIWSQNQILFDHKVNPLCLFEVMPTLFTRVEYVLDINFYQSCCYQFPFSVFMLKSVIRMFNYIQV